MEIQEQPHLLEPEVLVELVAAVAQTQHRLGQETMEPLTPEEVAAVAVSWLPAQALLLVQAALV